MKKIGFALVLLLGLNSCVSSKKYQELDDKFIKMRSENVELKDKLDSLENNHLKCSSALEKIKFDYQNMKQRYETLNKLYSVKENAYKKLQSSYDALSQSSSQTLAYEADKSKKLLKELEKKEQELAKENERLKKLKSDLDKKSQRVDQMEALIAEKDNKLQTLKESLKRSLTSFEGQGLEVHEKNGKLYISMENKLLFPSGSWTVKQNGKIAINKIAKILSINPDVEINIEGHTDNIPYHGKTSIVDNWDLSVKRATSVVRELLKNKNIDPKRLVASGRSKFYPIANNSTANGRAKNRRIEIILNQNMDKIMKLLND